MNSESTESMTVNRAIGGCTMKITFLIVAGILGAAASSQGQVAVVYQSDFTGTTLADAGLAQVKLDDNSNWIINDPEDRLEFNGTWGNARASVYTSDSWQNDGGFTLDVTFNQIAVGTRFAFGIVDDTFNPNSTVWITSSTAYGIGFATSGECGGPDALVFADDGSGCSQLSTAQGDITFNTLQTLSITVTPFSYSYSVNGAPATTGTFGTSPFDTSRSYRFIANAQRGNPSLRYSYFTNITLTPVPGIPTLSEWGMIVLICLVVAVMGRRMLKTPVEA